MGRSIRSFSLDSEVQARLDSLLVDFDNDKTLVALLIPAACYFKPSAALSEPKPNADGLIPWDAKFAYNQALKQVEKHVKQDIKINCSRLVSALLMLGMDILQERLVSQNITKPPKSLSPPFGKSKDVVSAGR